MNVDAYQVNPRSWMRCAIQGIMTAMDGTIEKHHKNYNESNSAHSYYTIFGCFLHLL